MIIRTLALLLCAGSLAACQSATTGGGATPGFAAASTTAGGPPTQQAMAMAALPSSNVCTIALAGGPPPKPAKGADFAQNAVAKNVGRNVSRNLITNIGARFGGGLGGAVAGGLASNAIRTEQDLKGRWYVTDGKPNCGCEVEFTTSTNLSLQMANNGRIKNVSCGNGWLAQVARWDLGKTFTGYDAPLVLRGGTGAPVANLKRDGVNYFSGTLADGTPVTLWRRMGEPG